MASLDKPLSEALPTAMDLKLSGELEARLHHENVFEAPDECARREEVLGEINEILQNWVMAAGPPQHHLCFQLNFSLTRASCSCEVA